ncbi:MAG: hypothetical protein ACREA9_06155, partial [Pyrinomonadaceae bacterium]
IPVAWPADALQEKGTGIQVAQQYRDAGLNMTPEHAQFLDSGDDTTTSLVSVEAGIQIMNDMMVTGRWRVAAHLEDYFEEFENYHRDNGKIVKIMDDLISASRYAMMMKRYALSPAERKQVKGIILKGWRG